MSKVLNALDVSEQSYQASVGSPFLVNQIATEVPKASSKLLIALLVLAPATVVSAYMIQQTYQSTLAQWQLDNQPKTVVEQVPYTVNQLEPMSFEGLVSTYDVNVAPLEVQPVAASSSEAEFSSEPEIVPQPTTNEPLLEELDLSELSPELALRIENALGTSQPQPKQANEQVSNLAHQADRWQGKLPRLDFQTHVYSSNPNKRWVKVNGTEFSEGDVIAQGVVLERIEQNLCQLRFEGEVIEVPALYDWQG